MNNDEIRQRLDQAIASPEGVSLTFERLSDAKNFRMACYTYRRRPGNSPHYDDLMIRIVPPATILIEHRRPLPAAEAIIPPTPEPKLDQA